MVGITDILAFVEFLLELLVIVLVGFALLLGELGQIFIYLLLEFVLKYLSISICIHIRLHNLDGLIYLIRKFFSVKGFVCGQANYSKILFSDVEEINQICVFFFVLFCELTFHSEILLELLLRFFQILKINNLILRCFRLGRFHIRKYTCWRT